MLVTLNSEFVDRPLEEEHCMLGLQDTEMQPSGAQGKDRRGDYHKNHI